jgi:Ca2+-binding EF-hand superfamily protein
MSKQKGASGFDPAKFVSAGITLEQVQEIKSAFDLFDTDLGGSIDTK